MDISTHCFLQEQPPALLAFPQRIGILGGTFNPIHVAHVEAARQARAQFLLQEVIILPSGIPPHKGTEVIEAKHRLAMANLAVEHMQGIYVSDMEVSRDGITYTVDTLRALHAQHPAQTTFFYIIGSDTLPEIITWREAGEVMRLCELIVLYRPGFQEDMERVCGEFKAQFPDAQVYIAQFGGMDISSRDIRMRIAMDMPVSGLISPEVEAYIRTHKLYQRNREQYS